MEDTNEARRRRIEWLVKAAGLCVVGFMVAPFILVTIKGLVGLVVAGGIATGTIFFMPVVARTAANWRLKAIKAEAARNPVETLQNLLIKKRESLVTYQQLLVGFGGELSTFADSVRDYERGPHDEDKLADNKARLQKARELYELKQQRYSEAVAAVDEFEGNIERVQRDWDMACAADRMNKSSGQIQGDAFDKISSDASIKAVQQKLNASFAELDMAFLDGKAAAPRPTVSAPMPRPALADKLDPPPSILEAEPVVQNKRRVR